MVSDSQNLKIADPSRRNSVSKRSVQIVFCLSFSFLIAKTLQNSLNSMGALDTRNLEQLGKTGFKALRIKLTQSSLTMRNSEQKRTKSIAQGMGIQMPSIIGKLAAKVVEEFILADIAQELIHSRAASILAKIEASFLRWGERLTLKNWRRSQHISKAADSPCSKKNGTRFAYALEKSSFVFRNLKESD